MSLLQLLERTASAVGSRELCLRAGITYRQLDYWCRMGYIAPSLEVANGSGTHRRWNSRDVKMATILGQLSRSGVGRFEAISRELAWMRDELEHFAGWILISTDGSMELVPTAEGVAQHVLAQEEPMLILRVE